MKIRSKTNTKGTEPEAPEYISSRILRHGLLPAFQKSFLIFSFMLVLCPSMYLYSAQPSIWITGAVRDSLSPSIPIPNAVVYLLHNRLADTTKSTGNFTLLGDPLSVWQNGNAKRGLTTIQFLNGAVRLTLPERMRAAVNAYSLQGRLLHTAKAELEAGVHCIQPSFPGSGISFLHIIVGGTQYIIKAVRTGENALVSQSQAAGASGISPMSKQSAASFEDTILVCAAGYDQRRFPVTKQILSGLRIRCLKTTVITEPYDSVVDIEGNVYRAITIGAQTWMAENLRTTRFNDGVEIPQVTDGAEWKNLTTPGYCLYDNSATWGKTYGALYNWYAVDASNVHNLAPKGWHVATEADWAALETYLGGWSVAGGKLKETGTEHWNAPNKDATNETKFSALPGGKRYDWFDAVNNVTVPGVFLDRGYVGWWWASNAAACRNISENDCAMYHSTVSAYFGASVRCVKDN